MSRACHVLGILEGQSLSCPGDLMLDPGFNTILLPWPTMSETLEPHVLYN